MRQLSALEKEQKLIDIGFSIAMIITDKRYSKKFSNMTQEKIAEWVAEQYKGCGFPTVPCGMSWGVLTREYCDDRVS